MNFIVLAGGNGTRLFPLSRKTYPKQFLQLTNELSLFQNTIKRIKNNNEYNNIIVICNKTHVHLVEKQLKEINVIAQIVIEPCARDTAAAICISALLSFNKNNSRSLVLPCDHLFDNTQFEKVIMQNALSLQNDLTLFGKTPEYPSTDFGYIEKSMDNAVLSFKEKPNIELAKQYIQSKFLWNLGIFLFNNESIIKYYDKYEPQIKKNALLSIQNAKVLDGKIFLNEKDYTNCKKISFDYAILEKIPQNTINCVEYNYYWNDLGNFCNLHMSLDKDLNQNYIKNKNTIIQQTKNCYINTETQTICNDLQNLSIIQTSDCLYISSLGRSKDIKTLLPQIQNKELLDVHRKVYRPWGAYENLYGYDNDKIKIKVITVFPGQKLSLQSHKLRCESWTICSGNGKLQLGDTFKNVKANDIIFIDKEELHRIENTGENDLVFTETQLGICIEDDIERFDDIYNRV